MSYKKDIGAIFIRDLNSCYYDQQLFDFLPITFCVPDVSDKLEFIAVERSSTVL